MTLSKTLIIGYVGNDPEMRYTPGGDAVTNFSVAVNYKETTTWFRVSTWRKLETYAISTLQKALGST